MDKLILAPFSFHKDLLDYYRQNDPFVDVKIVSKDVLSALVFDSFKKEAIPVLMNEKDLSYEQAREYLKYLPYIEDKKYDNYKLDLLADYKRFLASKDMLISPKGVIELYQNKEADVYGYFDSDVQFKYLLSKLNIKPNFIYNDSKCKTDNCKKFALIEDEALFVLNEICDLIAKGEDPNNIFIETGTGDYQYYLDLYSPGFNLPLNVKRRTSLFSQGITGQFIKEYDNCSLESAIEVVEQSSYINKDLLLETIKNNTYTYLNKDKQLELFVGVFKNTYLPYDRFDKAVKVLDEGSITHQSHIFVLGFVQGSFPTSFKDNEYLSDKDKAIIHLNTSLDLGKISQEEMMDNFKGDNTFHFSYSEASLSDKFFPSPLIEKLGISTKIPEYCSVFYSKEYANFVLAKLKDNKEIYKEESDDFDALNKITTISHRDFNNEFTNVKAIVPGQELVHSYSSINDFYLCPFSYYLKHVLKLDPFETTFQATYGTFAHEILSKVFDKNFDFDNVFDSCLGKFDFTKKELLLVTANKNIIKDACEYTRLHYLKYMNKPATFTEKNIVEKIAPNTTLKGFIDCGYILDNKYLVLLDYKTGSEKFNSDLIKDGLSLQLPIYSLLASYDKTLKDYEVAGLYINNIVPTSYKLDPLKEEELCPSYLKWNGKTACTIEKASQIDSTLGDGKTSFINSVSLKKDGNFKSTSAIASETELSSYKETALEKVLEADKRIRDNQFEISPFVSKEKDACKYCAFRDICYLKEWQKRKNSKEEDEDDE